tara:strand:+ start:1476 stop:1649 length:174 start_codon:yes stop_codon:yes gene_type:complete
MIMEIQARDPSKWHFYVSVVKSCFRLTAGFVLMTGNFIVAGALVALAEVFGILEEVK